MSEKSVVPRRNLTCAAEIISVRSNACDNLLTKINKFLIDFFCRVLNYSDCDDAEIS